MSYRRDFVIGLKETRDFYTRLLLRSWIKGIIGFGLAGGLTAWYYLNLFEIQVSTPVEILISLAAAVVVMALAALVMALATRWKVAKESRRSGRERYVQHTLIDGFGLHVTVDDREARLGFDKLMKVEETKKAFYLYLAANQAWILPKDQMEDQAAECARLREIFSTVIESKGLKQQKKGKKRTLPDKQKGAGGSSGSPGAFYR